MRIHDHSNADSALVVICARTSNVLTLLDSITDYAPIRLSYFFIDEGESAERGRIAPSKKDEVADPDQTISQLCDELDPVAVLFIPSIVHLAKNPSPALLRRLAARYRLVQLYLDLAKPFWHPIALAYSGLGGFCVTLDQKVYDYGSDSKALLSLLTPLYTPVKAATHFPMQNIPVSFIGSLALYPERQEAVQYLRDLGIDVRTGGGLDAAGAISPTEYLDLVARSRIVLNFSSTGVSHEGRTLHGIKGRVWEALSRKALLLESQNDVTSDCFVPGRDFVYFDGLPDLADKVRYYLAHEEERAAIALRGYQTQLEKYSAKRFWSVVLAD